MEEFNLTEILFNKLTHPERLQKAVKAYYP